MAAKMDEVLTAAGPSKKILFAVGNSHWLTGSDNMISLLEDYGYSMQPIPYWNGTQAENPSNEYCGVVLNLETGIFVEDTSLDTATSSAPAPAPEVIAPESTPAPFNDGGEPTTAMPSRGAPESGVSSGSIAMKTSKMMFCWVIYTLLF